MRKLFILTILLLFSITYTQAQQNLVIIENESGPNYIKLKWKRSTHSNALRYNIYKGIDKNNLSIIRLSVNDTSFIDTGLNTIQKYFYLIKEINTNTNTETGFFTDTVSATPTTVWYVSLQGSNSNLGGINNPLKSIQSAVNKSRDGDTILINPGNYIENIEVFRKSITIKSIGGSDSVSIQAFDPNQSIFNIRSNWDINNLAEVKIVAIRIENRGNVFRITERAKLIVSNSTFKNNTNVFSTYYGFYEAINCLFIGNSYLAFNDASDLLPRNKYKHCTITNSKYYLFNSNPALTTEVYNSILHNNNLNTANTTNDLSGKAILNNCIFDGTDNLQGSTNVWNINPGFISSNNYRLSNNSGAIGRGSTANSSARDYDENIRPQPINSNPDLGPFESVYKYPSPSIISITSVNNKAFIKWSNNTINVSKYRILRSNSTISNYNNNYLIKESDFNYDSTFLDTNVILMNRYYYCIQVGDTLGNWSGLSNIFSIKINSLPTTPVLKDVESGPRSVKLFWSQSTNPNSTIKYEIKKSTDNVNYSTVISNYIDTTYIVNNLTANVRHFFKVIAIDTVGTRSIESNIITSTPTGIWYVSPNGLNTNIGSKNNPLLTINNATQQCSSGDTIILLRGAYSQRINLSYNKKFIIGSEYILNGDTNYIRNTTINASSLTSSYVIYDNNLSISSNLVGFRIINTKGAIIGLNGASISDMIFENNNTSSAFGTDHLIRLQNSSTFTNNFVYNCGTTSTSWLLIFYEGYTYDIDVSKNKFLNNKSGSAIVVFSGTSPQSKKREINSNLFKGNNSSWHTIYIDGSFRTKIYNNIIVNNNASAIGYNNAFDSSFILNNTIYSNLYGIRFNSNGNLGVSLINNIISNNNSDIHIDGNGSGTQNHSVKFLNNVIGSTQSQSSLFNINNIDFIDTTGSEKNFGYTPLFNSDYSLSNNSLIIGMGSVSSNINVDYFGNTRPNPMGSNPDIGAYESPYKYASPTMTELIGGNQKIEITWEKSKSIGVTKYRIFRSTSSIAENSTSGILVDTINVNSTRYIDSGLSNLTRYYYRIQSGDNSGVWSGMSNELNTRPNVPPTTPVLTTAEAGPRSVYLEWTSSTSTNSTVRYNVYRGTTIQNQKIIKGNYNGLKFIDNTVSLNVIYYYSIRAIDTLGSSSSLSNSLKVSSNKIIYVSNSGDSSNNGSLNNPLKTIKHALDISNTNDTIILLPGTYYENIVITKNLTIGSLYLNNLDTNYINNTIIDGKNYFGNNPLIYANNQYIKINILGLTIQNATNQVLYFHNYSNSLIKANKFIGNGNVNTWGVVGVVGNVTMDSCYFKKNLARYVVVVGGQPSTGFSTVSRTVFTENGLVSDTSNWGDKGILFLEQRGKILNNILFNNYIPAITTGANGGLDTFIIANNTIFKNRSVGLYFSNWGGGAYQHFINNIIENNKINVYYLNLAFSKVVYRNNYINPYNPNTPNQLNYNITFINNDTLSSRFIFNDFDYRKITSSSKIINRGTTLHAPSVDYFGSIRPNPLGSNPDIGAYESPYNYASPTMTELIGGNQKIEIKWEKSQSIGVTKYRIFRSISSIADNSASGILVDTINVNSTRYIDSGLSNLTRYYYRIQSGDNSGVWSGMSNELSTRPNVPPTTPVLTTAEAGPRNVFLSWTSSTSANSTVRYNVYRGTNSNNISLVKSNISATSLVDSNLSSGINLYYSIRSTDTIGGISNTSNILTALPTNLWYVSNNGSNTNLGGVKSPLKTIQYAVSRTRDGDTVLLNSGNYIENVEVYRKSITIKSIKGSDSVMISAFDPNQSVFNIRSNWDINNLAEVKIIGIRVQNGNNVFRVTERAKLILSNSTFKNNTSVFSTYYGFYEAINCLFTGVHYLAFNDATDALPTNKYYHCTITNSLYYLFNSNPAVTTEVYNSILYNNNLNTANTTNDLGGKAILSNCIFDGTDNIQGSTNVWNLNPGFISSSNFRLSNSSLAIGKASIANTIAKDYDGNNRPQPINTNPDLGAFENENSISTTKIDSIRSNNLTLKVHFKTEPNNEYLLYRDTNNNPQVLYKTLSNTANLFIDSSIQFNTRYYYSIKVKNNIGQISGFSNIENAVYLSRPILLYPSNNSTKIKLDDTIKVKKHVVGNKYLIQLSSDSLFSSSILNITQTDTSRLLSNLQFNRNYFIRVKSINGTDTSSWSSVNMFQTELSKPRITSLTTSDKKITINWQQTPSLGVVKYRIYRDTTNGASVLIDSVGQNIFTYSDSTIINNKFYYYRVVGVNQNGVSSGYSNERRGTSLNAPIATNPINKETKIILTPTLKWRKNNFAISYKVQYSTDSLFSTILSESTIVDTQRSITTALSYNTNYYWRVRGVDSLGQSSWSSVNRFQTELSKPSIDSLTPGNHKVKLAWSYLDTINISHYNIYRYNIASNKFDSLKSTINNKTFSHVDSGLINDVDYRYIITAVNINSIESDNSNESSAIPFNKKPKAIQLNDKIVNNAGRNISTSLQFSSIGSIDEDGIIDSVVWYVNNKRVSNSINLNYGFRQGTSKVLMKIYDNDMAQDSSIAYVTISTFKKKMNGPVFAGLSAVNDNLIYAADYSYINGLGAKTIQIDSTGKTNFDLIVTQQIRTTPSVTNDSSVLITNGSLLNGFTKTGNPLFGSISLGGISEVTPTIDSTLERIYVGVSNRKFFAFNYKVGGQIAWDYISDAPIVSSAVITADRKLIFADQIGNIYGFDILTTNSQGIIPKWKYNLNDSINTSPAVDNNGNIVVGSVSGKLYKLTLNNNGTVTILWSTIISNKITSSPIIDGNGFIYVGSLDGKLTKVNSNNGSIVWDYNSGAEIRSTPSMSNTGIIYFGNENGMLTAIDTTGRLYWYYKDSSSISANILHINGTTYIGTHNGNVLAFWDKGLTTYGKGISSKITEPQWGTYQGNSRRTGIQNNILSVGVNNTLLKNNIKIYPNPTHDKIMIEIELKQINEIIEVYDLTGKLVLKEIISGNSEIDLSSFNSGVYIIKIKDTYTRVIKI